MRCSQVQAQLSEYLDGELRAPAADAVRRHLATCAPCEARWRGLRRTVRLVAHLGHEKCPVDLRPTVALAVADATPPARRMRALPLVAASSLAAAVVAGVLLLPRPAPEAPGGPPAVRLAGGALHDQYDLATSLGTADGLMLALPGNRHRRAAPHAAPAGQ